MLPFPLNDRVPPELCEYVLGFWWDMEKLHALHLPIRTIPVADLLWHLDLPWWKNGETFFCLTPHQVQTEPQMYHEQYERTMQADLRYPIIVRKQGAQFVIMDGIHRLLKAVILGKDAMVVKVFSEQHIPDIVRETRG